MRRAASTAAVVWMLAWGTAFAQGTPLNIQQAKEDTEAAPASAVRSVQLQSALNDYAISSLRHRAAVFEWQLTTSKVIFCMVIALVVAGVVFSAIQFGVALRRRTDFSDAEIAMSMEGVKIRSQFLGVITLALALGFFYLYLKTVYPVVQLPESSQNASTKP